MERKFVKSIQPVGNLQAVFTTERHGEAPLLDTEVKINDDVLCWITLPEKEKFVSELNAVINKYRI